MLFIKPISRVGSESSRYTDFIKDWVTTLLEIFIWPNHINKYSNQKGGDIYDSSGTTAPPPLSSIFYHGEWTLGLVLDIYWKFAESGNHYLGHVLDGLYQCSAEFGVIPPNLTVPSDDQHAQEALNLCFEKMIDS